MPELVMPDDITVDLLKALFDSAYMTTKIDSDGDLYVKDDIGCYVLPTKSKERIQLMSLFSAEPGSSDGAKLAFANRVNDLITTVRVSVNKKGGFTFDYYIPIEGGITRKAIVLATKFFLGAIAAGIKKCDTDDVVA